MSNVRQYHPTHTNSFLWRDDLIYHLQCTMTVCSRVSATQQCLYSKRSKVLFASHYKRYYCFLMLALIVVARTIVSHIILAHIIVVDTIVVHEDNSVSLSKVASDFLQEFKKESAVFDRLNSCCLKVASVSEQNLFFSMCLKICDCIPEHLKKSI